MSTRLTIIRLVGQSKRKLAGIAIYFIAAPARFQWAGSLFSRKVVESTVLDAWPRYKDETDCPWRTVSDPSPAKFVRQADSGSFAFPAGAAQWVLLNRALPRQGAPRSPIGA